ncbi:PREDICTED: lymphocyte transmembrane adapter 1 isoform X2 [Chinchilla lanigera]|uniref:lymphocyte transmembrane adapter 1 isoform X2 n=1 Tax=Chinchilla lanigera TaxID=34839 RepID=UPI00038EEEAA|nr:PREDICTED: lymphocyte transmembrane adapter 1 isoform X2 [Chinchilla lanigera]
MGLTAGLEDGVERGKSLILGPHQTWIHLSTPCLLPVSSWTCYLLFLNLNLGFLDHTVRDKEQSSIFSGFAGLLALLLIITASCILWNWNKKKRRQVPYLRVTSMPSLTLPQPRPRAKNIYDLLPRRQAELGRRQSRSIHIFSTESLISRTSDSPEHVSFQTDNTLQSHRVHIRAVHYALGVYDNASVPQMHGNLAPSAHYINITASRDGSSTSSEESNDYVNVPTAEETAEMLTSTNNPLENVFVLPSIQELEFNEEGQESCGDTSDGTSLGLPGTEGSDPLSDGEGSSQTSHDYVNMTGLDIGDIQEKESRVDFQGCRDYVNVPAADPSGSQQQAEEEEKSSNTDCREGRTDGPGTHTHPVTRRSLSSGYCVVFLPSIQSGDSQMTHGEEVSDEDSDDYENVLAAELGGRGWEQGPGIQLLPDQ